MLALRAAGDPHDVYADPEALDAIAQMADACFELRDASGTTLTITTLGSELDADWLWVYQQMDLASWPQARFLAHCVFHDLWPQQVNLVNLRIQGRIHTLRTSREQPVRVLPAPGEIED